MRLRPLVLAGGLLVAAPARGADVAVVMGSERDVPAAAHLEAGLGPAAVRRSVPAVDDPQAVLEAARAWPERLVVVVDTGRRIVRVVRVADGTILSRVLEHLVAERAPYAVSVAALELLELVGYPPAPAIEPAAAPAPAPAPPPAPAPAPAPPPSEPAPGVVAAVAPGLAPGPRPGVVVLGGALLDASTDGDLALVQPAVGVEVQVRWKPWVASAGLRVSALGGRQRSVAPGTDAEQILDADVEYSRTDLSLRIGFGTRGGEATALAVAQGGVGFVTVTGVGQLNDGGPSRDGEVTRLVPWLGAGGELRYVIGGGAGIGLDVAIAFQPSSVRYTVDGTGAYEEGNHHVRGGLFAFWESP